jgi:hypothetical protein
LTHNLPTTEAKKIMKFENLNLEIKNIWKLNNVAIYPSVISVERVVIKNFLKISREYRFNQKHLKSGAKSSI